MRYLRVVWLPMQNSATDPAVLWIESEGDGWETRKVDEYGDGRLDFAPAEPQIGLTWLADRNDLMSVEEMNESGEFEAAEIPRQAFEAVWERALASHARRS